ncbi:MAG TPA: ATP-binding cassette domain-containing protein [Vicinamibacteria bacterium]|nr:ATP-binding cassette domain-containing protein [Vicinamibacteria bacterium]
MITAPVRYTRAFPGGVLTDPAIRITEVTKTFGTHVAVHALDLEVPRGSVFGLLGPNGAGKTTTLRMVMNVLGPDSGHIEIMGRPSDQGGRDLIGYMPEERGLYQRMVLEDQLLYLAELKGTPRAVAQARLGPWLERMGLAEWRRRKLNELSKGMQQKAQFIATALHEPEVLILDEPMSGLDPVAADTMREVLLDLRRQGRTLVLSSHQMETVERLCDAIALINRGQKLLDGPVSEVKRRYGKNTVVLAYEGNGSFLTEVPGVEHVSDFGRYVEVRLAEGADAQVLLREAAARLRLSRFEIVEPSLRDIFVAQVTAHGQEEAA